MKRSKGALLFLVILGMELSWLYAWANFLTTSMRHQSFPFPEAVAAFGLAAAITHLSRGKGWRRVTLLGLQVLGLLGVALRIVYSFDPWSSSFLSPAWVAEFLTTSRNPVAWLNLILILLLSLMFWAGGVTLARRSIAYSTLCSRFDLGIAAFTLLFLTKFLLRYKGGLEFPEPLSQFLFFSFFIFSLLAIGLARNQTVAQKDFLPGYRGMGVILSFAAVVLLLGAALVLLFLPYLTLAAEGGYAMLKTASKPLGPVLVSILRFLFARGTLRPEPSSIPAGGEAGEFITPGESSPWMQVLEKVLTWVFGSLLGLVLVVVCGVALFFLFRWLLSRTPAHQKSHGFWYSILLWIKGLRAMLFSCWKWMRCRGKRYQGATRLYQALQSWGRHSGLPHAASETPLEYALRLRNRFPPLEREVESIIEALHQEVYAEIKLSEKHLSQARLALRRMRSPLHWPSRLKRWFMEPQSGDF